MKKLIMSTMLIFCIGTIGLGMYEEHMRPARDAYIRQRVVGIESKTGFCSGIQVQAPSGKVYILTAAHCSGILEDGKATVKSEDGKTHIVKLVKINHKADLMLLTSPSNIHIKVSKSSKLNDHIRAITRGARHSTYTTEGEILEDQVLKIGFYEIDSQEALDKCIAEGRQPAVSFFSLVCVGDLLNTIISAPVAPGSSGGPVVNDKGELVGIVSTGSGFIFSGMVPLSEIKAFLKGK